MVEVKSLMFAAAWGTPFLSGANLDATLGCVEPPSDADGKVGEVDMLILGAGPSSVATCSPSRSILDYRS